MCFRDTLPVRVHQVDECEAGNERVADGELDDDRMDVERVDDRVDVLERVVFLVVVGVLDDEREHVGECDGVWLDDGVPAGVGKAVRVGLLVCDDVCDAVCVGDIVPVAVSADDEDDVDADVGDDVSVAVSDGDGDAVDAGVGNAVRVVLALGVIVPTNVADADAG